MDINSTRKEIPNIMKDKGIEVLIIALIETSKCQKSK